MTDKISIQDKVDQFKRQLINELLAVCTDDEIAGYHRIVDNIQKFQGPLTMKHYDQLLSLIERTINGRESHLYALRQNKEAIDGEYELLSSAVVIIDENV